MRRHHHDAIGEIHGFGDVVGHVDHGLSRFPPHIGEQPLHVVARERIECRERFVHQQHRRIVGKRTRDRDPLLHAARQVMRKRLGEVFELDEAQLLERDPLALGLGQSLHFQAERHVAKRGAPRKQLGEVLKHHAAIHAVALHLLSGDADFAGTWLKEPGDDVEQR